MNNRLPELPKCTIIQQIQESEKEIKKGHARIKGLEERLQYKNIPLEQKRIIQTEIDETRKLLEKNQEILNSLHGKNTQTFMLTAAVFFLVFLTYGFYLYFTGKEI